MASVHLVPCESVLGSDLGGPRAQREGWPIFTLVSLVPGTVSKDNDALE